MPTNPGIIEDELETVAPPVVNDAVQAPSVTDPAPNPVADSDPLASLNIKPITNEVNAETDTVEGRMNSLTASGSQYITQAENDARRESNNRGLINSTMAAGAGREAAIRAALPIAQQDAKTYSDTRLANQADQNKFLENRQSTDLNKEFAELQQQLDIEKTKEVESFLQDIRFSDELKLQYVATINNIVRDAQAQIVQIGLSERTAAAQAAAIARVEANRDAEIEVYQDLLGGFDDWHWSTDFTPGGGSTGASTTPAPAPAAPATVPGTSTPSPYPSRNDHKEGDSAGGKMKWHWNGEQWVKKVDPNVEGGGGGAGGDGG